MKKKVLTVITIITFGLTNAQEIKFGVKGGVNITNWTAESEVNVKSKTGFNAGVIAEIKLSDKFDVQPELLYSTLGTKFTNLPAEFDGDYYMLSTDWKLSYIVVPVMFKYNISEKFNVEAGPQIGFLTSAKFEKIKMEGVSLGSSDAKDMFQTVDFALNAGLGYNLTENVFFGIRYGFGLSNITKREYGDSKLQNRVLSLTAGYKF
ncbi:porin family protein [Flavobacterium gelatinilyticum]|uniref:porin family protein n=1 Tax=Flavobacterium gelatinilyticum TaxID=3003260 RepID=UPI00247FD88E|nr:porin family protein [Flavobacterium gelatinilyticum]